MQARTAARFGVDVEGVRVDFGRVMQRMRELRAKMSTNDSAKRFATMGVDVFQVGQALPHSNLLAAQQTPPECKSHIMQMCEGMPWSIQGLPNTQHTCWRALCHVASGEVLSGTCLPSIVQGRWVCPDNHTLLDVVNLRLGL